MSYKIWILIAILLFGAGIVLGLTTPAGIAGIISEDIQALQEFARGLTPFSLSTAIIIFAKNASAMLISFIFSPIFCLTPILALAANGWIISFISTAVIQEKSLAYLLAGILPHGVFELPALIMAQAAALSFGATLIIALVFKKKRGLLLPNLKKSLRYLALASILFVPAAIIETYVTPAIVSLLR